MSDLADGFTTKPQRAARRGRRVLLPLVLAAIALAMALLGSGCRDSPTTEAPTATGGAAAAETPTVGLATTPTEGPASSSGPAEAVNDDAVVVIAVGDLMFAREVVTLMETAGADYPFERVARELGGGDLLIGNLEGTFTDRGAPLDKVYTFRAPPPLAVALRQAGFDAVSLANNHAFDFGAVGLADTRAALDEVGVAAFGAGANAAAAHAPILREVRGQTVALLGYDDIPETQAATVERPGVAWAAIEDITREVRAAAAIADHVLVMLHAGTEYDPNPNARQRALAEAAIGAGADVVIGHHPHVLQSWERIGDGVMLYSLGNFVFDLDPDDLETLGVGPFYSAAAVLTLRPDRPPGIDFRPVVIDEWENRPRPATEAEAAAILAALYERGAGLGSGD